MSPGGRVRHPIAHPHKYHDVDDGTASTTLYMHAYLGGARGG
jgi:hypothetical protein